MFDLIDWLGGLAHDTVTHGLAALTVGAGLLALGAIGLLAQRGYWAIHDRYSRYGIRRPPPQR